MNSELIKFRKFVDDIIPCYVYIPSDELFLRFPTRLLTWKVWEEEIESCNNIIRWLAKCIYADRYKITTEEIDKLFNQAELLYKIIPFVNSSGEAKEYLDVLGCPELIPIISEIFD